MHPPLLYDESRCAPKRKFSEVDNTTTDIINLVNTLQMHKCGSYCMRKDRKGKRYCRAGCGIEQTVNSCDTPGFKLCDNTSISTDRNGLKRLMLKRNMTRMVQSSTKVLQSWRGNCDVQLIIYSSHPDNPDLDEISKVTDYVVAYACKGNSTHTAERQSIIDMILE